MIAVDTNVLVRFLVRDDDLQYRKTIARFARAAKDGEAIFVSEVVLCEMIWVLAASYDFSRSEISHVVDLMLSTQFSLRDGASVKRAIDAFAAGKGGFADYLIREIARGEGIPEVLTFDRALLREPGFSAP